MAGPAETMVHHLLLQIAMLRKIAGTKKQKADDAKGGGQHATITPVPAVLTPLRRATFA